MDYAQKEQLWDSMTKAKKAQLYVDKLYERAKAHDKARRHERNVANLEYDMKTTFIYG